MYDGRILSSQHTAVFTGSQDMALGHRKNKEQGFSLPWAMNIFTAGNLSSSLLCLLTRLDFAAVSALIEPQTMTGIRWCRHWTPCSSCPSRVPFHLQWKCLVFLPWRKHGRKMCSLHSCQVFAVLCWEAPGQIFVSEEKVLGLI